MKKLSKDEMKKVMGGIMAPPDGGCKANAYCSHKEGSNTYVYSCVERDAGRLGCICVCSGPGTGCND